MKQNTFIYFGSTTPEINGLNETAILRLENQKWNVAYLKLQEEMFESCFLIERWIFQTWFGYEATQPVCGPNGHTYITTPLFPRCTKFQIGSNYDDEIYFNHWSKTLAVVSAHESVFPINLVADFPGGFKGRSWHAFRTAYAKHI